MSFIKKYLPTIETIASHIEADPKIVYTSYSNADAYFGPNESMDFINEFLKAYDENPNQDFTGLIEKYTN